MSKGALEKWFPMLISALVLSGFAVLGSSLVGLAWQGTTDRIEANQRQALLDQMSEIIARERYDNDLLSDTVQVQAPEALGAAATTVYRARQQDQDVGVIFSPVIARGYAGDILLTVGVLSDGRLAGVRVISHKETPGLGDKIEPRRHPWILGFSGKSLLDPSVEQWAVQRDGGVFDQFTGATITPRAVVAAVRQTLTYFDDHRQLVFSRSVAPPTATPAADEVISDG